MKKFLFLILLLILVKLILYYKENLINNSHWNNYRLGDIIWGWIYKKDKKYYNKVKKRYPNSIADLYIKKTNKMEDAKKFYNFEVLEEIINQKKNELDFLPGKNDLVLHIRIGDALKKFKNGKYYFSRKKFCYYPEMYEKLLNKNFKKNTKKKVFILYGSHFNTKKKISEQYIKDIEKIFRDYGFIVERKNSGNPDKDYIFMAKSYNFIRGGGGYSNVLSKHIKYKGNNVLDPKDYN